MNRRASVGVLLSSHCFKNQLDLPPLRRRLSQRTSVGEGRGKTKIGNDVFQSRQIKHLYIEFQNKSQMALLADEIGTDTRVKSVTSGF
jgi:hypothetical protein